MIRQAIAAGAGLLLAGCSLLDVGQRPTTVLVTVNASDREAILWVERPDGLDRMPYQPCSAHSIRLDPEHPWRLRFNDTTIADSTTHPALPDSPLTIVRVELHNDEASVEHPEASDQMPDAPFGFECDT